MNENARGQEKPVKDRSGARGPGLHLVRAEFDTAIGSMVACATDEGLYLLLFRDAGSPGKDLERLGRLTDTKITPGSNNILAQTEEEVTAYLEGRRRDFSVPLSPIGSEFHQKVWRSLLAIPYGETRSYAQQAEALNRPLAVRAVAAANGRNPIALMIPCHRVIGGDGSLKGYRGGLEKKRWLLDLEMDHAGRRIQKRLF